MGSNDRVQGVISQLEDTCKTIEVSQATPTKHKGSLNPRGVVAASCHTSLPYRTTSFLICLSNILPAQEEKLPRESTTQIWPHLLGWFWHLLFFLVNPFWKISHKKNQFPVMEMSVFHHNSTSSLWRSNGLKTRWLVLWKFLCRFELPICALPAEPRSGTAGGERCVWPWLENDPVAGSSLIPEFSLIRPCPLPGPVLRA